MKIYIFMIILFTFYAVYFSNTQSPATVSYRYKHIPKASPIERLKRIEARFKSESEMGAIDLNQLAEQYLILGMRSENHEQMNKALQLALKSLHKVKKGNLQAELILAKYAETNHQFDTAIMRAKKILKSSKGNMAALNILASAYMAKGQFKNADTFIDQMISIKPRLGPIGLKALNLAYQGRGEEAAFYFNTAFKVEDHGQAYQSSWLRSVYARYQMQFGKLESAEQALENAIKIDGENALARSLVGELALLKGNAKEAREQFAFAHSLSGDPAYLMNMAKADSVMGRNKSATKVYDEARMTIQEELDSGHGHYLELTRNLLERPKMEAPELALKMAKKEWQLRQTPVVSYWLALSYMVNGKNQEALETLKFSLKKGHKGAETYHLLGLSFDQQGAKKLGQFYKDLARQTNPYFQIRNHPELVHVKAQKGSQQLAQVQ